MFLSIKKKLPFKVLIIGLILIILISNYFSKNPIKFGKNELNEKNNMFFIETNLKRDFFSQRQLCAVESAALHNPNAIVKVYSINAKINEKILDKYSNIQLFKLDFTEIFKGTIFETWFVSNKIKLLNGPFYNEHASDILRIVLLWKFGGYYSDLDTITVRNIQPLLKYSGAALQEDNPIEINNAVLFFAKKNSFLFSLMKLMADNYNQHGWAENGQHKIQLNANKICNVSLEKLVIDFENTNKIKTSNNCSFNLFPSKYFVPVNWNEWDKLFKINQSLIISEYINVYSIHFFNKMSNNALINRGMNSVYEMFSKFNCPISYAM